MAIPTKFLALGALAITTVAALPTTNNDLVDRQSDAPFCAPCPPGDYCECNPDDATPTPSVSISTSPSLTKRQDNPNISCFPLTGTGDNQMYYSDSIFKFSTRYNGAYLHQTTSFLETYEISPAHLPGHVLHLSVSNVWCAEDAYFDYETCPPNFMGIVLACNMPDGNINVGGTRYYGCGHYMLQHEILDGRRNGTEGSAVAADGLTPDETTAVAVRGETVLREIEARGVV